MEMHMAVFLFKLRYIQEGGGIGNRTPVRVAEDFSSRRIHKDESSG